MSHSMLGSILRLPIYRDPHMSGDSMTSWGSTALAWRFPCPGVEPKSPLPTMGFDRLCEAGKRRMSVSIPISMYLSMRIYLYLYLYLSCIYTRISMSLYIHYSYMSVSIYISTSISISVSISVSTHIYIYICICICICVCVSILIYRRKQGPTTSGQSPLDAPLGRMAGRLWSRPYRGSRTAGLA